MGTVVVDASVVIAFLNPDDSLHEVAVRAVRQSRAQQDRMILAATALAEILVDAARLGEEAVQTTERFINEIVDDVRDIDRSVARAAARYRARHGGLRLPDALVIAVGSVMNAESVLTADRRWVSVDARVRLVGSHRVRERRRRYKETGAMKRP